MTEVYNKFPVTAICDLREQFLENSLVPVIRAL